MSFFYYIATIINKKNQSDLVIITLEREKKGNFTLKEATSFPSLHLLIVSTLYHSFGNEHIQPTPALFNLTPTVLTISSTPEGPLHRKT